MDEFDLVLLEGIRNGFFDPALVRPHAEEMHKKVQAAKSDSSWEDSWRAYHDSFSDNQQQVLDAIHQSFRKDVQHRTLLDLNGAVGLLKDLGRPEQATQIIAHYIASRGENRKAFDLDTYPFKDKIDDPDVIWLLKEKHHVRRQAGASRYPALHREQERMERGGDRRSVCSEGRRVLCHVQEERRRGFAQAH